MMAIMANPDSCHLIRDLNKVSDIHMISDNEKPGVQIFEFSQFCLTNLGFLPIRFMTHLRIEADFNKYKFKFKLIKQGQFILIL